MTLKTRKTQKIKIWALWHKDTLGNHHGTSRGQTSHSTRSWQTLYFTPTNSMRQSTYTLLSPMLRSGQSSLFTSSGVWTPLGRWVSANLAKSWSGIHQYTFPDTITKNQLCSAPLSNLSLMSGGIKVSNSPARGWKRPSPLNQKPKWALGTSSRRLQFYSRPYWYSPWECWWSLPHAQFMVHYSGCTAAQILGILLGRNVN